ncbi:Uncharacterized protein TCM_027584 [Theobroma cacao]|uniref:Uncharacterized protein n=1 Tax=Theobroma cacao TaxID=3641 RepID=A0A061GAN4_THECC|nr:Uncharacterized protein TCM_027584 [Theobroma cacao]
METNDHTNVTDDGLSWKSMKALKPYFHHKFYFENDNPLSCSDATVLDNLILNTSPIHSFLHASACASTAII